MSTPEPLKLACVEIPSDTLEIRCDVLSRSGLPVAYIRLDNMDEFCGHSLDAAAARALFNWLGVWLHTHAES